MTVPERNQMWQAWIKIDCHRPIYHARTPNFNTLVLSFHWRPDSNVTRYSYVYKVSTCMNPTLMSPTLMSPTLMQTQWYTWNMWQNTTHFYPGLFQKFHRALLLQSCGAKLSQEGVCSFSYMCLELVLKVPGITTQVHSCLNVWLQCHFNNFLSLPCGLLTVQHNSTYHVSIWLCSTTLIAPLALMAELKSRVATLHSASLRNGVWPPRLGWTCGVALIVWVDVPDSL